MRSYLADQWRTHHGTVLECLRVDKGLVRTSSTDLTCACFALGRALAAGAGRYLAYQQQGGASCLQARSFTLGEPDPSIRSR